jgi:hypothetical protein
MGKRVKTAVRVDRAVREKFEDRILEIYPQKRPYAGIQLEQELKFELEMNELNHLYQTISELESKLDHEPQKKETLGPPQSNDRPPVQFKIDPEVKAAAKKRADDSTHRSTGRFVESIMWRFVENGSVAERLARRVENLMEADLTGLSPRDKIPIQKQKALEIEKELGADFRLRDFKSACEDVGYQPTDYRIEQYLPIVLEHRGFTWHPNNPRLFIDEESEPVPMHRDPRNKPYLLMEREDIKDTILIEAYRKNIGHITKPQVTVEEIIDMCDGRPQKTTVSPLMRELDDKYDGLKYVPDRESLSKSEELILSPRLEEKFNSILGRNRLPCFATN